MPDMVTDESETAIRDTVRANLPRRSDGGLVLDFGSVEIINSIGITCLLRIEEDCRKAGGKLRLAGVPAPIVQFFRQLKLDRKFTMLPTVDDAVMAISVG